MTAQAEEVLASRIRTRGRMTLAELAEHGTRTGEHDPLANVLGNDEDGLPNLPVAAFNSGI